MKKVLIVVMAVLLAAACALTGCSAQTDTPPDGSQAAAGTAAAEGPAASGGTDGGFKIAFCAEQMANPYIKKLADNLKKYADEAGYELTVYDAEQTIEKQLSHIDTCIAQGINAIILLPVDAEGLVPGVAEANKAGIPVICIANSVAGGDYTMVGSDQKVAGKMQAEYLAEKLPENAKVLYMRGIEGLQVTQDRFNGFRDEFAALRPDAEIIADQSAEFARPEAMQLMEDWIQSFPDFSAVVAANDDMALGAKDALKSANRLDGISVCGVDALDETLLAIKDGEVALTILQDAAGQSLQAIKVCTMIQEGKTPEKEYMVPFKAISADNVADFIVE